MDAREVIKNAQDLTVFTHQHNRMLELCSQIADLNMPALIQTLYKMRALAGNGSEDAGQDHKRRMLEENLALALRAIEIQTEVCRQKAMYMSVQRAEIPRGGQLRIDSSRPVS